MSKKKSVVMAKEKPEGYVFGRPRKYGDEIIADGWKYVYDGWKETGQKIPSLVGLALYLGVVSSTVHKWREDDDKPDFSDICQCVMDLQHESLLSNGLIGAFSAPMAKMILTKHGYADATDVKNEYAGGKHIIYIESEDKKNMEDHISSVVDDIDADKTS